MELWRLSCGHDPLPSLRVTCSTKIPLEPLYQHDVPAQSWGQKKWK